jgi:hypothetical protein
VPARAAAVIALLAATGWSAVRPPHAVALPQLDRVVVVGLPHLGWPDLTSPAAPGLAALVRRGALGGVALSTAARRPQVADVYASLGAGAPAVARGPAGAVITPERATAGTEPSEVTLLLSELSRTAGPGGWVDLAAPATRAASRRRHPASLPGALGSGVHTAGARTAVVGVADRGTEPDRPAALAAMDASGAVDSGALDGGLLLRPDPAAPWAASADPAAIAGAVSDALRRASLVVVDSGDLERAAAIDPRPAPHAAAADHRDALARADAVMRAVVSALPRDSLLIAVSSAPPRSDPALAPLIVTGPGVPAGELVSDSTHRVAVANLPDVAATVLDTMGLDEPAGIAGEPLRVHPRPAGAASLVRRLTGLDGLARRGDRLQHPAVAGFLIAQIVVLFLAVSWLPPIGRGRRLDRGLLRAGALALASFPLATLVLRALSGRWHLDQTFALFALAAITVAIAGLARAVARSAREALLAVTGATLLALAVDLGTGGRLQLSAVLGSSPTEGARFYGLGSAGLGVVIGALLVGSALWLDGARDRRRALGALAGVWVAVIAVVTLPWLGAKVGGILVLVPVGVVVANRLRRGRAGWLAVGAGAALGAAALGMVTALDRVLPDESRSHLGRLARSAGAGQSGQLATTVARKLQTDLRVLRGSPWTLGIVTVLAATAWLLVAKGGGRRLLPRGSDRRVMAVALVVAALVGLGVDDAGALVAGTALSFLGAWLVILAADELGTPETLGYDPSR